MGPGLCVLLCLVLSPSSSSLGPGVVLLHLPGGLCGDGGGPLPEPPALTPFHSRVPQAGPLCGALPAGPEGLLHGPAVLGSSLGQPLPAAEGRRPHQSGRKGAKQLLLLEPGLLFHRPHLRGLRGPLHLPLPVQGLLVQTQSARGAGGDGAVPPACLLGRAGPGGGRGEERGLALPVPPGSPPLCRGPGAQAPPEDEQQSLCDQLPDPGNDPGPCGSLLLLRALPLLPIPLVSPQQGADAGDDSESRAPRCLSCLLLQPGPAEPGGAESALLRKVGDQDPGQVVEQEEAAPAWGGPGVSPRGPSPASGLWNKRSRPAGVGCVCGGVGGRGRGSRVLPSSKSRRPHLGLRPSVHISLHPRLPFAFSAPQGPLGCPSRAPLGPPSARLAAGAQCPEGGRDSPQTFPSWPWARLNLLV
ncbi:translation initiation factor IF-2-like [Antechinus flavipes]|uniref:translation initiation factor IF-2-like n=1 Tax=Antechinus flavipes TaxID=38775 RepID=UPI002235BF1B|nr:translation initiation factor IF-2-like [Antechinus flavipes]